MFIVTYVKCSGCILISYNMKINLIQRAASYILHKYDRETAAQWLLLFLTSIHFYFYFRIRENPVIHCIDIVLSTRIKVL